MTSVPADDPFVELPVLRIERLRLRRITESDAEGLFDLFSDDEVTRSYARLTRSPTTR